MDCWIIRIAGWNPVRNTGVCRQYSVLLPCTGRDLPFKESHHMAKGIHSFIQLTFIICAFVSAFRTSAVLFQYHEEHQYPIRGHGRNCRAGPLSYARSFTNSPHHFHSGDYKLRPLMVYHTKNIRASIRFPFYADRYRLEGPVRKI
jgi:hypothetical protein